MIVTGLSAERLDTAALTNDIRRADCGALVVFEGSTRSPSEGRMVLKLEYEAWPERAERQLRAFAEEAVERWGARAVVAVHRTGEVPVGEPSVVVAVAAPHRAEAFEAARWLIDTLKAQCAIWKKEIFEDGEAWAGV
ncbi:MAG: molybdenum cofactor biosynthesis protein MoaE [Actinomycetota bacterium]